LKKAKVWKLVSQQPGKCIDFDEDSDEDNAPFSAAPVPDQGRPNPDWDVTSADDEVDRDHFGFGAEDREAVCTEGLCFNVRCVLMQYNTGT
jgi:hypothetical protein